MRLLSGFARGGADELLEAPVALIREDILAEVVGGLFSTPDLEAIARAALDCVRATSAPGVVGEDDGRALPALVLAMLRHEPIHPEGVLAISLTT